MIELHSWITAFLYPIINAVAAIVFFTTYIRKREILATAFLGIASLTSCGISLIWLILRLQKATSVLLIPSAVSRFLWWVQAIAEYFSIGIFLIGVFLLYQYIVKTTEITVSKNF